MNDWSELREAVLQWAENKNIVEYTAVQALVQLGKTQEELDELVQAIQQYRVNPTEETWLHMYSELGDVLVTLIVAAECMQIDPVDGLQIAYDKISKRTGKTVNGVFVKD
jgi:NTP pyrophosphatase (non-canonical NTP hydrolase)